MPACHEVGHRADGVLDRRVRIDAVLVVQVDVVDAEALRLPSQLLRTYAGVPLIVRLVGIDEVADDAELGGDQHAVAMGRERPPDEPLVGIRAVHVGRVEEA